MNFLDTYGITGTGTSTPPVEGHPEQSFNEEVSQVIGTLGRFWGGFRKQSEAALATARRDLGQVVTQAQREFEKLTITVPADSSSEKEALSTHRPREDDDEEESGEESSTPTVERGDAPGPGTQAAAQSSSSGSAAPSFFARIQSSFPPNIVSTLQAQLPESLKNTQSIDFSQLRNTLSTEFQRVQGVTRAQAEEYVHKSETMFREAMREAGEVLRDAVKVIPPEEAAAEHGAPVLWDGSDVWMLPGLAASAGVQSSGSKGKGKETDSSRRHSEDVRRAVATRAESLLRQLRSNPEIIKVDPAVDSSKESYLAWVDNVEASGTGFGTNVWSEQIANALSDPDDGSILHETFETLVPSCMPEEVFWIRYFFRVHQIEQEEDKRKALLQATAEKDDDFSWEDEEEATSPAHAGPSQDSAQNLSSSQRTIAPRKTTAMTDVYLSPSVMSPAMSPRHSSEGSYDVISGNVSNAGDVREAAETADDSDWE